MSRTNELAEARRALGARLSETRRLVGMSQQQLAECISYSRATIAGLERGTQTASADFWRRCATVLHDDALYEQFSHTVELREQRLRSAHTDAQRVRDHRANALQPSDNIASALPMPGSRAIEHESDLILDLTSHSTKGADTVTRLWNADLSRRDFLVGAFAAVGYVTPALRWLTDPAGAAPTGDSSRLVGAPDVDTIREMTQTFRRIDNRFGGGHARMAVVRYLDAEITPLLKDGRYDAQVGTQLLSTTAELTQLVGWMAHDAGDDGIAQQYFIQALKLAKDAGDEALATEILAGMSQQCVFLGDAVQGIDLARAARQGAMRRGSARLLAEAAVMEAHGHAKLQDEHACAVALSDAERYFSQTDTRDDPPWMSYFDEAYMAAKFGHCFRDLDRGAQAVEHATRSLQMNDGYLRGRAFNTALLASAYAQQGEAEQAVQLGREATTLAEGMKSVRISAYLIDVSNRLAPYDSNASVSEFRHSVSASVA